MPCLRDAIFYFKVFSCHKLCGLNVSAIFTTELVAVLKYTVFFKVRIQESTFTIIWWKRENGACWCYDVYLNVSKYCVWIIICLCKLWSGVRMILSIENWKPLYYLCNSPPQTRAVELGPKFQALALAPPSISFWLQRHSIGPKAILLTLNLVILRLEFPIDIF